jgi:hypothetical protein
MNPKAWPIWKRVLWEALLLILGIGLAFPVAAIINSCSKLSR